MSRPVVLDTNILVPAGLTPGGIPGILVEKALMREMPVYVSPGIVAEYFEVLNRPKFKPKGFPPGWLPRLLSVAFREPDPAPWPFEGIDTEDLVFLALAKAAGAVVVTGNLKHFPLEIRDGVTVVSPADYFAL